MLSGDRDVARGRKGPFYYTLASFRQYWEHVDVIVPAQPGAAPQQPFSNVSVYPIGGTAVGRAAAIVRQAHELWQRGRYALIVSHDYGLFANGLAAAQLSRSLGVPYVSEIFHVPGYPRAADASERLEALLYYLYVQWAKSRAHAFRACNARAMPALYRRWGVPQEKVLVLPSHYINLEVFAPGACAPTTDVIFVGRLVKNKGLPLLLKAVDYARMQKHDITLRIVGEGPLLHTLQRQTERLSLSTHVIFSGWLPDQAAVAQAYNEARVVVCASYNEGGPRTTLEGMACGLPAVSTAVGAMPEVIVPGKTGFLADWNPRSLAGYLLQVLEDERQRQEMGLAARAAVEPFEHHVSIQRYAEGYLKLIGY